MYCKIIVINHLKFVYIKIITQLIYINEHNTLIIWICIRYYSASVQKLKLQK